VSKANGFVPLRRGIWEHVRDGRMSHLESLAFIYICSQADTRTGIWNGSAAALAGELGITSRTARDLLERMEHGDYTHRFPVPGKHTCYPILIHKFPLTQGEHNGEQLNALGSKSPAELSYFSGEHNGEQHSEHNGKHSAAQRRKENREKRQEKKEGAPAAPSPSTVFTGQHFSVTQKQDALLGEAFPWVDRNIEYRKADSWLEANPERRPKRSSRFLHNWFSRVVQVKGKDDAKSKTGAVSPDNDRLAAVQDRERREREQVN
jgi:hypothetical protein